MNGISKYALLFAKQASTIRAYDFTEDSEDGIGG